MNMTSRYVDLQAVLTQRSQRLPLECLAGRDILWLPAGAER